MSGCNHFLLIICLFGVLLNSCKKNTDSEKQQPCPGGCGVADFSVIDYQPVWSPDGKYIAYYHGDKEISKNGIYLITPDGKENRLWHRGVGAETPAWSPDGQWMAFSEGAQIWKKKLNGDSVIQITDTGRNFFPSWSQDGKWIAYTQSICNSSINCGLWLTNLKTVKNEFIKEFAQYPVWGSNSQMIYSTRIVKANGLVEGDSIWIYDLNNKTMIAGLELKGINYANNYFKYKNNKILFTSQPQNAKPQIWVMNVDGGSRLQLTKTQGYTADWNPDGNKIVYTDSRAVNGRLWIMNADGTGTRQLTFMENF